MNTRTFRRIMRRLEAHHRMERWSEGMSAFEALVSTILSQSTTVANERRGMVGLQQAFGAVTPERLARAPVGSIERAIWHAGLSRQKARRIRDVSRILERDRDGSLDGILATPTEEARRSLEALPGVGPKTADVVLAIAGGHPTFPVDTHVARIARRWGIARSARYEGIREALEARTPPSRRLAWHLAMIAHGRTLCKALRPRCEECPVSRDCDWHRRRERRSADKRLRGPEG